VNSAASTFNLNLERVAVVAVDTESVSETLSVSSTGLALTETYGVGFLSCDLAEPLGDTFWGLSMDALFEAEVELEYILGSYI
jgi:hypothetical protein